MFSSFFHGLWQDARDVFFFGGIMLFGRAIVRSLEIFHWELVVVRLTIRGCFYLKYRIFSTYEIRLSCIDL